MTDNDRTELDALREALAAAEAALGRVRALVDRWHAESQERGDGDRLFTSGVVDMLRAAIGGER